ncbi:MAG: aspartate-semialdehyde dehydrogenase, partial [Planctomycetes bacterium]|nr:aspartate-semialdehyde dehydrogenase [Planctomycetota bacterium]
MIQHLAVVGATGAVGCEFCALLEERNTAYARISLFASARGAGAKIVLSGREHTVHELNLQSFQGVDYAVFSAGSTCSSRFAPLAVRAGTTVIDNSSAFRMDRAVPLVIREINPADIPSHHGVVANPNCSTIIMNMAVWPLHRVNPVRRIVVSTYQAASGAGAAAMEELRSQTADYLERSRESCSRPSLSSPLANGGKRGGSRHAEAHFGLADGEIRPKVFPHPIAFNLFSHDSPIGPDGYNTEERKMIEETRKIFHEPRLAISATCVRVPIVRAHSAAINLTFENPITPGEVREILSAAPGIKVVDDVERGRFPMPIDATGGDDCLVGRIRQDVSQPDGRGIELFVCGDQLRKGAALNAIQIL